MFEEEQLIEEQQVSLQDYIRILYRGKWTIIFSFLIVLLTATFITFTTQPVYEAKSTVLIQGSGAKERMLFDDLYFGNQSTMITNQIEILKSRSLAKRVVTILDGSDFRDSLKVFQPNEDGEIMSFREMTQWFQDNLEISHRKDTDLIDIVFSAGSPFECLYIANVTANEFRYLNAETNKIEVTDLRQFLEEQIEKKGEELKNAEDDLKDYQEKEKVASLDDETTQLVERFAHAESMLQEAQIELNSGQERKQSDRKSVV